MPIYRIQVEFDCTSGLPEDKVVNVWHGEAADVPGITPLVNGIIDFYGETPTGHTASVSDYLGYQLSRAAGGGHVKVYDLSDPTPRVPVYETTMTLQASLDTQPFPAEVASCFSFKAAPAAGAVAARRRGRIYLGPLANSAAVWGDPNDDPVPNTGFVTTVKKASQEFLLSVPTWRIYSRVDDAAVIIESCWMDNAFDTQRRRGQSPTTRTAWDATTP